MTRVLFLDDMEQRANTFRSKYPDLEWTDYSQEAIALLKQNDYDLVCLDYDLDLSKYSGDSGKYVVNWLANLKYQKSFDDSADREYWRLRRSQFIIHSTNLIGATGMLYTLLDCNYHAVYVPFTYESGGPFNK